MVCMSNKVQWELCCVTVPVAHQKLGESGQDVKLSRGVVLISHQDAIAAGIPPIAPLYFPNSFR